MKNSKHTEERKMADIRDSKNWGFETKQLSLIHILISAAF